MSKTLSVVVPNFNHAAFLPKSLAAIFSQSRQPDEVIVVDDGSTDNSVEVIKGFAQKYPQLQLVSNPQNIGVITTLDKGLALAACEYVHCAGADDLVLPGFYEKSLALLEQHPAAAFSSALSTLISESGDHLGLFPSAVITKEARFIPPAEVLEKLRRYGSWFLGNSAVYRREALKEVGFFRVDLKSYTDNFAGDLLALMHGTCFIPEPLVAWRRMSHGYSSGVSSKTDEMVLIMDKVAALMQGPYASFFPRDYFDLWKRRHLQSLLRDAKGSAMAELKSRYPRLSVADRLYFSGLLPLGLYMFLQKSPHQKWDAWRRRWM